MAFESINASPSDCTSVGTRPSGLNCRMSSKSLPTDQLRCSNGNSSKFMLTATRRTNGESNMPIKIIGSVPAFHNEPGRHQGLRQFNLDTLRFGPLDVLQMQGRPDEYLQPALQNASG